MLGPTIAGEPVGDTTWSDDSVRNHLEVLLNTRRGSYRLRPDFGLPEIPGYYNGDFDANILELTSEIKAAIKEFEPRLSNLKVIPQDERSSSQFRVTFLISGEVQSGNEAERVQYRTTIKAGQHAEVSGD